jgi:hypothetical protein
MINPSEPIIPIQLNLEKITSNLPSFTDEKICEMIICDRYFGLGEKISGVCMQELIKRRVCGSSFNFEEYIETQSKTLPELNFTMDIRSVLQKAMNGKIK